MPLAIPIVIWFMDPFQWFFVIVMKSAVAHAFACPCMLTKIALFARRRRSIFMRKCILSIKICLTHIPITILFYFIFRHPKMCAVDRSRLEANAQHIIIICNRIVWPMTVWLTFVRARAGSSKFEKVQWQRCPPSKALQLLLLQRITMMKWDRLAKFTRNSSWRMKTQTEKNRFYSRCARPT